MRTNPELMLAAAPAALAISFAAASSAGGPGTAAAVTDAFFALTIVVEAIALIWAARARDTFAPGDPGRATWTLVAAFLAVRIVAELRYLAIAFGLVPAYHDGAPGPLFVYVVVLRYLFSVSDLLLIAGLASAVRAYRGAGLHAEFEGSDYALMGAVGTMVLATVLLHPRGVDAYLAQYRVVGSVLAAIIGTLTVVVRCYARQLGAGALAGVWNAVVLACAARAASFFAATLVSRVTSVEVADFVEQCLLWAFACGWLLAALRQRDILRRAVEATPQPA